MFVIVLNYCSNYTILRLKDGNVCSVDRFLRLALVVDSCSSHLSTTQPPRAPTFAQIWIYWFLD